MDKAIGFVRRSTDIMTLAWKTKMQERIDTGC